MDPPVPQDPPGIPTEAILARTRDGGATGTRNALTHEPPATAWNGIVTTYAATFGGRRRLIWTTAEELEELRPVADTEQHHMRSYAGRLNSGLARLQHQCGGHPQPCGYHLRSTPATVDHSRT